MAPKWLLPLFIYLFLSNSDYFFSFEIELQLLTLSDLSNHTSLVCSDTK